jgi:hypothetical protein
MAVSLR